jgi:hypothetical protein
VFDAAKAFLERAGYCGGDPAGMPVESENTAECLKPERIRQAPQQFLWSTIGDDVDSDFAGKACHAREQPRWRAARMQRKVGESGATGHVSSYGILQRRYRTTVRASGSNPKFRMNAV